MAISQQESETQESEDLQKQFTELHQYFQTQGTDLSMWSIVRQTMKKGYQGLPHIGEATSHKRLQHHKDL